MTCIENAIPSPIRRDFPNVEASPLYRFLAEVFSTADFSSVYVYFGTEDDLPQSRLHRVTVDEFLALFKTASQLDYGIYEIRLGGTDSLRP